MKHNFKITALLIIVLCVFQNAFGQSNADASGELQDLQLKAQKLRAVKSYRTKTTIETFDAKGTTLKYKNESVSETLPPDRRRYTSTAVIDGKTRKTEMISIGEKNYLRIDGGAWKLDDSEPRYGLAAAYRSGVKIIEETTLNGQPVKVFEEKGGTSSDEGDKSYTKKYWLTAEGELLKTESEEVFDKTNEIRRSVTVYEYDPNIKIEAPIKP
jgi:hypothetical protein